MRAAVQVVIRQQEYEANAIARALSNRRTGNIALIIPRAAQYVFANPYFSELFRGVTSVLESEGYNLLVSTRASPERFRTVNRDKSCDGVIFAGVFKGHPTRQQLHGATVPVVVTLRPSVGRSVPYVDSDDVAGAYAATMHLVERGRTRLALVCSDPDSVTTANRLRGHTQALRDAGVPRERSMVLRGCYYLEDGHAAMRELISMPNPPTGIMFGNDLAAFGGLVAAQEAGVSVPRDVSIVGFGNVRLASATNPPLTTVDTHTFEIGSRTAELLLQLVRGEQPDERHIVLPTKLVVREST